MRDDVYFYYVIASKWDKEEPLKGDNLRIYTYITDLQYGTEKDAKLMLQYVNNKSDEEHSIVKMIEQDVE